MSMTTVPRGRSNEPPTSTVRGGPGQYPVRLLAGLVAALLALAGTLVATGTPARAAGNQPPVLGHGANLLYVYLDTGELLDTAGLVGVVAGPDGSVVGTEPGTYGPAEEPGVWTVLLPGAGFNTGYDWRVEAQDAQGTEIPGRVWTNQYGMRQGSVLHEADLEFWVLNDTGYRYKVDLRGYNGINSIIQANALGNTTPDCTPLYGSVELDDPLADPVTCGARYRVFFEEPAPDLPETADGPEGTVYVAPDLLTAEDLVVDDLAFTPEGAGAAAGTFS